MGRGRLIVSCTEVLVVELVSLLRGDLCHRRLTMQLPNRFCSFLCRLCGNYAPSYNLTFLSSQNVMLVALITNKEGRYPGFKAEFFQLPKMKGKRRPWPSFPHLSLPQAAEEGIAAVAVVSLPGIFPRLGDVEARSHLGSLCLPCLLLLAAVMMSPEEGKIRVMLDWACRWMYAGSTY